MAKIDPDVLFSRFLDHPRLIWIANNTGCEAKADLMAEIAHDEGHEVVKTWVQAQAGDSESHLLVYLNEAKTEHTLWGYHVAPMIKTDGEFIVLDPSLFDAPVALDEWKRRLSLFTDECGMQLVFKTSPREAFYGPDDMLHADFRQRALVKRETILDLAANLDDPTVYDGFLTKRRGKFADALKRDAPDKFRRLKFLLRRDRFAEWFRSPIRNERLARLFDRHERYFGIDTKEIASRIDLSAADAFTAMQQVYWERIGAVLEKLTARSHELRSDVNDPTPFAVKWEMEDFRALWFAPTSDELWEKHGLPLEDLPQ